MIEYIDKRLREWGNWSVRRDDGSYSEHSGQYDYEDRNWTAEGRLEAAVLVNDECIEIEAGMSWMRHEHRRIANVLVIHYRDHPDYTAEQNALLLGIARRTYFYRIDQGHIVMMAYINDRAAGTVPSISQLRADLDAARRQDQTEWAL